MLLLHLIKKDVLITKGHVFAIMVFVFAVPLFLFFQAPFPAGTLALLYTVALSEVVLLQNVINTESKNPKATALLCTAPHTRKAVIQARYLFFVLRFSFYCIVHALVALVTDPSNIFSLTSVLAVLLFGVILFGSYVPIALKYGSAKAHLIFVTVIILFSGSPFILSQLLSDFDFSTLTDTIAAIPGIVMCTSLALLSLVFYVTSMKISLRIFDKKEL